VIYGAQGSRDEEEQAQKILLAFYPWTTNPDDKSDAVPHIGELRGPDDASWKQALVRRVRDQGFPTEEVKRYLLNFCFAYCLPRELQSDNDLRVNSDNEDLEDALCCAADRLSFPSLDPLSLSHPPPRLPPPSAQLEARTRWCTSTKKTSQRPGRRTSGADPKTTPRRPASSTARPSRCSGSLV
jgi:hypothetical protein